MGTYLVEAYVGRLTTDERGAQIARARVAAEQDAVEYLSTIFVPEDETCFHLFVAPSRAAVEQVSKRARLDHDRIVEAA